MTDTSSIVHTPRPAKRPADATVTDHRFVLDPPARPAWAMAGWVAGLLSFAVFLGPASAITIPNGDLADNADVVEHLQGAAPWIWAFQTSTFVLAVMIAVFGVGLRHHLARRLPGDSLLADLAALGAILVSALLLVGGGISTEMFHSVRHLDETDPDTVAAHLALYDTMAWVWAGGVLTTASVAVAGLRHEVVGRRTALFAGAMSVLLVLTQLVPLQYLAVLPMALFLVVTGISLHRNPLAER